MLLTHCVIVAFVIWNKSSLFPCGKATEGQLEKKCFVFVGVLCGGFFGFCFCCFLLEFFLWAYRNNIFLERNILSMVLSAVLCLEGEKPLETVC